MKEIESEEVVSVGSHVIVQKLNYKKVYRVSETGSLVLGKEEIKMSAIIGKPFWTTFKVIAPQEKRNDRSQKKYPPSTLVVADKCESLEDLKNDVKSGFDNRSINDDGKSQKLSKDDILGLRDAGKSGREIVISLIENNASFREKTEYSQEKYIRKKEKKYCQYLSVHKPTLSSLHEIYLRQDPIKIYGLRMDTLAQILCYSDVKCNGTFLLYDSGSAGLAAAGIMSRIGSNTSGNLIYLHSGDHLPQMPIVRAMNFPQEQLDRLTVASIFDFLNNSYKNTTDSENSVKSPKTFIELDKLIMKNEEGSTAHDDLLLDNKTDGCEENKCDIANFKDLKRKNKEILQDSLVVKKSRKVLEIERAVELLSAAKADSLTIVAREHPLNIVKELLLFLKSSRPVVIYHAHREPLEETYIALKQQNNIVNLRLFSNFLRSYQVLADRTHPDILTNDCGGYILTGYIVN
ncbi:PREDICTED: tRNA (adenine(58)-N(1))-methyltransferase non-catalytic subunit TRM6 [Ceratosolen solmsi marchali]|uniref:tRNA (adenine(58)-N(1))-methyltransferase non-catalytic subunit TRM6 n=1 Tax=Ceratosolen solmsi marchali TaxID=326594 RepID=A0AAJ6YCY5_9HYME|nr:PREDICTED: tRNA (adenine(58)-N(1))-methyltransferase non-catalytic subunit TRM6 [Ceratosolen solmsi marchali]